MFIGPGWLSTTDRDGNRRLDDPGDWVRLEVEAALRRPEVAVVPVLVNGAEMPPSHDLPDSLKPLTDRQAFIPTGEDPKVEIDGLVTAMQQARVRRLAPKPLLRLTEGTGDGKGQPSAIASMGTATSSSRSD